MAANFPTKRRSTLGRRHLRAPLLSNSGEEKTVVSRPTLALPTPGRGLYGHRIGQLSKSCKKTQKNLFVNCPSTAKKPQAPVFTLSRSNFNFISPNYSSGSYSGHSDSSLNLTGVQPIPISPELANSKVTNPKLQEKLEPPKSPAISQYDKMMMKKLNNIKPPVDPDDVVEDIETLNLNSELDLKHNQHLRPIENDEEAEKCHTQIKVTPLLTSKIAKTSPYLSISICNPYESKFSPHLSSTYVDKLIDQVGSDSLELRLKSKCPSMSGSAKKLSIINENKESFDEEKECNTTLNDDFNSTDSFLLAEQTMIDQDEVFKVPTAKKAPKNKVVEQTREDEEEVILKLISKIDKVTSELEQAKSTVNHAMTELSTLKPALQHLLEKINKRKGDNKENCPDTSSKRAKKLMNDLKSENPNLVKTPQANRLNGTKKPTWTPHSLSMVLQDQVDDLFDD